MRIDSKAIEYSQLGEIRKKYPGKKIVHCHGVFDLFHYGHLLHLQAAKKQGDILVVTVTADRYVNKGPHRPHHDEEKRFQILAHLEIVDHIALSPLPTAVEAIQLLKPDFYVKGPDYSDESKDPTGGIKAEKNAVELIQGKIIFTNGYTDSSTQIINRYFSNWSDEQQVIIDILKSQTSIKSMLDSLDECAKLKVLVVGEPIIDRYVFCNPVGVSSKSATIAAQFIEEENHAGGSLAIANHLAALGCETTLLLPSAQESFFQEILKKQMLPAVHIEHYLTNAIPTPIKTRFLQHSTQRMFELINVRSNYWANNSHQSFIDQLIELSRSHDVVMVADFGHGLFEKESLQALKKIKTYMALNVQTNSGNFGFNPFTKHDHFDYLCLDEPELRVAMHDRLTSSAQLADDTIKKLNKNVSLTLGHQGSILYTADQEKIICPAFFKRTLDTTGAGDAYFSITSLLNKIQVLPAIIPFVGNCFAGLHTQTMGNKNPVSKVDLIRVMKSIMA